MMIEIINRSVVPYRIAESWQRELAEKRHRDEIPNTLLLLEHPSVFTIGRRESDEDLLVPRERLTQEGIELVKTDRGGRITYHGPGQLVGYFIFRLKGSIPEFVRNVEELVIRLLDSYGLKGERDPKYPGVWVGHKKISALGLHFEHGISRHGFALNVDCNLKPFGYIHPCGIQDRTVTSMEQELEQSVSMEEVRERIRSYAASLLSGSFS